jgi:hypothetical protein
LRQAHGGYGLLGHALTGLGDLSFGQHTHKTLLRCHLPGCLLLNGFCGRHVACILTCRRLVHIRCHRHRLYHPSGLTHRLLGGCRGGGRHGCPSGGQLLGSLH